MQIVAGAIREDIVSELNDGFGNISFSQFGEDLFIMRFFRNKRDGFYIDAGAFHPKRYSNTFLLRRFFGWKGINIDASKRAIDMFDKAAPNDINVHAALDEKVHAVEFIEYRGAAHSTIDSKMKMEKSNIEVRAKELMTTTTMEILLENYLPENQVVDFLSIDVEGVDLKVVNSWDWEARRPLLVCVEDHDFIPAFSGGRISETSRAMTKHGYRLASHHTVSSLYVPN